MAKPSMAALPEPAGPGPSLYSSRPARLAAVDILVAAFSASPVFLIKFYGRDMSPSISGTKLSHNGCPLSRQLLWLEGS